MWNGAKLQSALIAMPRGREADNMQKMLRSDADKQEKKILDFK